MLSRAGERSREVAIQTALGARRWRVMRQHMTETLVLASVGAAGGLLVANGAASAMAAMLQLPVFLDFSIDWRTMIAALAIALFAMVAIGVYPAWRASQPGLATSLKDGGQQTSSSLERARFRQVLITVQIAGTCLLLVLAGAMLQNLRRALVESPGFVFDRVAVLDPSLRRYGLDDAAAQEYWDRLTSAIRAFPETDAVALVSHPPLGRNLQQSVYPETGSLQVTTVEVEPGFFTMMGIPLLRGRTFAAGDDPEQTVIISRRLALAMYRSLDVLGLAFPRIPSKYAPGSMRTIVGVAEDARLIRFTADDGAEQYRPVNPRQPQFLSLLASARTDAGRLIRPMRDAARTVDDRVLVDVRVMSAGLEARLTPSESGAPLRVCSRSWRCRSHASAPLLSSRTPQRDVREKSAFA